MKITRQQIEAFVKESNKIENIWRWTLQEVEATEAFIELPSILILDIAALVNIYQPGERLRDQVGLDVLVGDHIPLKGGPDVEKALERLVVRINDNILHPYTIHQQYEWLHPFTDGNGRSGRAIWARMMVKQNTWPGIQLGFLHAWYYQSLERNEIRG